MVYQLKNIIGLTLSVLTIIFVSDVFAQKQPPESQKFEIRLAGTPADEAEDFYRLQNMRVSKETGMPLVLYRVNYPVAVNTPEIMAKQYLRENAQLLHLKNDLNDLVQTSTRETPGGWHIRFLQYFGNFPVYKSEIVVNISRDYLVTFVINGYKPRLKIDRFPKALSNFQAAQIAKNYLNVRGNVQYEKTEKVVFHNNGLSRLVFKTTVVPAQTPAGDWEILIDAATGEVIKAVDNALYHHFKSHSKNTEKNKKNVTGSGWVFDPDPLTRANAVYGNPGFIDNNDNDSDSLTTQLMEVNLLDITFDGNLYFLDGPYAKIVDSELPFNGVFSQPSDSFFYTRSQDQFEAVNVYYHIDKSMRYINETLGFNLMPHQYTGGVKADPHGLNEEDNSHYLPSTGQLAFGEGGVDDAEDVDVIIHELGHGLHDWLTHGNLSVLEGLSEGSGDYWTASYIRSLGFWQPSDDQYNWVFHWDGHNEFWDGRITNYAATYPDGLTGDLHIDGQMWASTLMQIWNDLGREVTDSNFLEALSMLNISSNQEDAAQAFIQADINLYGGIHLSQIGFWFTQRGYTIDLPTPTITHSPLKDTENITGPYTVTANIEADNPLKIVNLIFETNDAFTDTLEMTINNNQYTASIPGTNIPTNYNYYIFAADTFGFAETHPIGAPVNFHQFYAGPDTILPVIIHTPLKHQTLSRWPAKINAQISDNIGLSNASVEYIVNNSKITGTFQLTNISENLYEGLFDLDTSMISIGDSIQYRIMAVDSSMQSNQSFNPPSGYHTFHIINPVGIVLVINDDPVEKSKKKTEKGLMMRNTVKNPFGESAELISEHLQNIGYVTDNEDASDTNPAHWDNYDLVIWSSGTNSIPISNTSMQTALINYVNNGGKLLLESGEAGWFFQDGHQVGEDVLHIIDWIVDNDGAGLLNKALSNHPIAENLPQTINFNTQTIFFDIDVLVVADDAFYVFDWTKQQGRAGVIVHDDKFQPKIVFFSFSVSSIADEAIANLLIENTVNYLFSIPEGIIHGSIDLIGMEDDSGAFVQLIGEGGVVSTTTGVKGDYLFDSLNSGTYKIIASVENFYPYQLTIDNIIVNNDTQNVDLLSFDPIQPSTITGKVLLQHEALHDSVFIQVAGQDISTFSNSGGDYTLENVLPGNVQITASKNRFIPMSVDTILENDGGVYHINFELESVSNKYLSDFETDNGGLTSNGQWEWGKVTSGPNNAYSGSHAWGTVLNGEYANHSTSLLMLPELKLTAISHATLTFRHWYNMQPEHDGGNIQISTDNGTTWKIITPVKGYDNNVAALDNNPGFTGAGNKWSLAQFDLSDYISQSVRIRFNFRSDADVTKPGWYIDDIFVHEIPPPANFSTESGLDGIAALNWEVPAGSKTVHGYRIYRRDSQGSEFKKLHEITNPAIISYQDSTVVNSHPYAYYITALYDNGENESIPSTLAVVIPSKNAREGVYNHETQSMATSISNKGNIGFINGFPGDSETLGSGFIFNGENRLFQGALLIATSPEYVSDAAQNENGILETEFKPILPISADSAHSWTVTTTGYNDAYADNPFGVEVFQNVYSRDTDQFIIWSADIVNRTGTALTKLVVGFYMDWNINSTTREDRGSKITISSNGKPAEIGFIADGLENSNIFMGAVALSQNIFHAYRTVNIQNEVQPPKFTDGEKWTYLNVSNESDSGETADYGQIFSVDIEDQSLILADGDTFHVAYAFVGGIGQDALIQNAESAIQAWFDIGGSRAVLQVTGGFKNFEDIPASFDLFQNFPNPFNPITTIRFQLPEKSYVTLRIFDVLGREIKTLIQKDMFTGYHSKRWDATNNNGRAVSSGIYFYQLQADNFIKIRKMILMR